MHNIHFIFERRASNLTISHNCSTEEGSKDKETTSELFYYLPLLEDALRHCLLYIVYYSDEMD